MTKTHRVFISYTSEFTTYPEKKSFIDAAVAAVNRAGSVPYNMEYFTARDQKPAEYCVGHVKECDVYIGIIGFRYGSPVRDRPDVSYTELEFEAATEARTIKRLVFLLDPGAVVPAGRFMDLEYGVKQEKFRKRLVGADITCGSFSDAHQLEKLIYQALKEYEKEMGESNPRQIDHASSAVLEHMVKVPKGPFLYGEGRGRQELNHDYWIDIYPVTNEQYGKFILANGYEEKDHWSPEGWKAKGNITVPSFWDKEDFNKADHPVVGVCYYEAEAYAKWRKKRLPTEQEWEKAARGDDGRHYPWGNDFDTNKCNGFTSQIGHTTPVSQYPNGISPYGCYDMVGNVSEWCASQHDGVRQDYCVLRGGGWDATQKFLKISNRGTSYPLYRYFNIGFRLVQDNEP